MPKIFSKTVKPGIMLGLWQIAETEAFFSEKMPLAPHEAADLEPLKDIRRLEWLACRWLLHEIAGHDIRMPLMKDAFSKPFFPEHEHLACSLSHSKGVVAALLCDFELIQNQNFEIEQDAPNQAFACGCDLQKIVPQMPSIAPKFMRLTEMAFVKKHPPALQNLLFHVFWTAKESLYKAWGKKALDFREHIMVGDFEWTGQACSMPGRVEKSNTRLDFQLHTELVQLDDAGAFLLTWCI